jgi:hypothetical protein
MTKKMLLMLLFLITISRETFSIFELGKEVTNTENLVPYPGGDLYTFKTPKMVIVRRSDNTLKYAIAYQFTALRCDTPLFACVVDFNPATKKATYKKVSYDNIYLAPEWITKNGKNHTWNPEAEAGALYKTLQQAAQAQK